jgi:hypothetical protein
MKAPADPESRLEAAELTTKEARQGGRQHMNLVVLVIALTLLVVVGLVVWGAV